VARRRGEARREDVAALAELVRGWQEERERTLAGQRKKGLPAGAETLPNRERDHLRRLSRDLDQLGGALAADHHALEQAALPLEEDLRQLRMLPFSQACEGLERAARDLAAAGRKEVVLAVEGGDVELDRAILEGLRGPLLHLVRNALDHGIETPAERLAAGKPAQGAIRLSAAHSGAHVLIRVADDGTGLDPARILAKAVDSGLVAPGTEMADAEVLRLIFHPGFTTAQRVTEVSGRGVGLDVVERGVHALRGSVDVRSRPGEGTVFTLKLPLTLAIVDGLLVSVGNQYFVLPVANVLECVELARAEARATRGRGTVIVRDEMIPYVPLRDFFGIPGEAPAISQVMLAETESGKFGFAVDRVIGDHQTVIKSLGRVYRSVEGISGATILGDGAVALILDLDKLVEAVRRA
jgi:two-component system chemotaxis sensor kinase CheA